MQPATHGRLLSARTIPAALGAVVALLCSALPAAAVPTPGAAGIGDSYFPLYGNGGYDVQHYGITIRYNPATDRLAGFTHISALARKDLSRLNLDFVGLHLSSVEVNDQDATWTRRRAHELIIRPRHPLQEGNTFTLAIRYAGLPRTLNVPGTDIRTGVVPTDDGAIIWGEPEVAAAWFPVNDHPRDKARYTIHLTVPAGLEGISNGRLAGRERHGDWTTWTWNETDPMASYLAVAAIGDYRLRRFETSNGLYGLDAVDVDLDRRVDSALAEQEEVVDALSRYFGPYPFDEIGAIVEDKKTLSFSALETQTRPIYDHRLIGADFASFVIAHEVAHQWYGDSVSVHEWKHIWLNEGFATYSEWLWGQHLGLFTPEDAFNDLCTVPEDDPLWDIAPGDPGREALFHPAVYQRGGMALQALRHRVGGRDFLRILRRWAREHRNGTGTTAQFKALAERVAGQQLDGLFRAWLFIAGKPAACGGDQPPSVARRVPEHILSIDP